jgi:hypothetical protein
MTIQGAIAERDAAVIWSDTLLSRPGSGEPAGHCSKLAINTLAGCVGTGRGWGKLASEADAALLASATLDEAVPAVCKVLRQGAARHAPRCEQIERYSFAGCGYLIAGFSAEIGRVVVWDLDALSNFEPALASAVTMPPVECAGVQIPSLPKVRSMAAEQAVVLRDRCERQVGRLTIAIITTRGITVLPPEEIALLSSPGSADAAPAPMEPTPGAGEAIQHIQLVA